MKVYHILLIKNSIKGKFIMLNYHFSSVLQTFRKVPIYFDMKSNCQVDVDKKKVLSKNIFRLCT